MGSQTVAPGGALELPSLEPPVKAIGQVRSVPPNLIIHARNSCPARKTAIPAERRRPRGRDLQSRPYYALARRAT
jgi:hypothetical protein